MLRFALFRMICSFSQFPPVWVWFCFAMFLVFLSLCSILQLLLKLFCLHKSNECGSTSDESSEREVDSETSSTKTTTTTATDEFDVFLSFRGADTRQGFTDVIYDTMKRAGIRVFRDDDEVSVGQPLQKILHAIEMSQICVPIFSRTFASSSWCLREVAKMMELKKPVMPIFYNVKPDDLKLKSKAYRSHLKMHENKHGKEKVKVWEDALSEVARIKGKELLNTGYTEFCKKFVDEVLSKLRPRKRLNTENLVGMDSAIECVMELLEIESPDFRCIGIHGMGGIGKTTLARALFEELSADFDSSFFLGDILELSSRCNGLQDLQKQLQAGLDPEYTRGGGCNSFRDIEERFRRKKVLIVLDDVNKSEQIRKLAGQSSWFGSGSRIIVTCRNVDVLMKYEGLDQNEVRFFEMDTLEHDQALELFQRYAFRKEKPRAILETISREIVSSAGGLPLALKVIGSRLYNIKDERVWREVTERSRQVQDKDVKERLRISYDALEHDQKKIFLDIACVPDMKDKVKSVYVWEASKLYPYFNLALLSSMSLVKFNDDHIWMHDLLRDLGMDIVREESSGRSRVWNNEEALEVLLNKEGKEKVEVLCVDKLEEMSLTSEHFAMFQELRFLKLVGTTDIQGDFKNLLPKLTWFIWHSCPPILNATNLYMKNLVVLNLSYSFISESWGGWSLIQTLNSLKVLDLSHCHNLTRTPDFSRTSRLERLDLRGCSELHEIHVSIGKLQRLKYLNLKYCYSLDGLPNEIGCLVNLEEIHGSGSQRCTYFNLPTSIRYLESLSILKLEDSKVVDIPDSIGGLAKLKHLSLQGCSTIKELPESLGNLESLCELDLSYLGLSELPNSIGGLVKLKSLSLKGCSKLEVLPESLGYLALLTKLDLSRTTRIRALSDSLGGLVKLESLYLMGCCNLEVLPETLGNLRELKVLQLEGCKIRKLPVSIGLMKKLRVLYLLEAKFLEEVPMEIGGLSSLTTLMLTGSSISNLPSTISQLKLLKLLDLESNHQLQELPDLPQSLSKLRVSSRSLQKTPNFSRFTNLMELMLLNAADYRWPQQQVPNSKFDGIDKLMKLRSLELGLGNAIALQFDLGSLTLIESLRIDFQPDFFNRVPLMLLPSDDISQGMKLPDLSSLKNMSKLTFQNCWIEDGGLLERLGIQHLLGNVEWVCITNCSVQVIELICLLKLNHLRYLTIWDCGSLKTLPDLSELKNLQSLYVRSCKEVVEIPGLENLESLGMLYIIGCESLERLESLSSKLEKLPVIILGNCPKLRIIEGTDRLLFSSLSIDNCRSLQNVDELKKRSMRGRINGLGFEN